MKYAYRGLLLVLAGWLLLPVWSSAGEVVHFERLPAGGVQPQSAVDAAGTVHVVYLTGDAKTSDVNYIRRKAGDELFSQPLRVNSEQGSAVAIGTMRGAQLAVAPDGTVHVLWNGSQQAHPKQGEGVPLLYARLTPNSQKFEAQRNLMTRTYALDGGGSLATDRGGRVYVAWHGMKSLKPGKETDRAVFLAVSEDNGASFGAEREVSPPKSGSCPCCGLRLGVDEQGALDLVFRAAFSVMDRDILWLQSKNQGRSFEVVRRDAWRIGQCPLSSAWVAEGWTGWEAGGTVKFARLDDVKSKLVIPKGDAKRKHPVAVQTKDGRTLLVWTEGTGWQKGGAVVWQMLGVDDKLIGNPQRRNDLPVWGLATAWADGSGQFFVLY